MRERRDERGSRAGAGRGNGAGRRRVSVCGAESGAGSGLCFLLPLLRNPGNWPRGLLLPSGRWGRIRRAGLGRPPGAPASRGSRRLEARAASAGPRAGAGRRGSGAASGKPGRAGGRGGPRPASAERRPDPSASPSAARLAGPPPLLPAAPPARGRGSARPGAAARGLRGSCPAARPGRPVLGLGPRSRGRGAGWRAGSGGPRPRRCRRRPRPQGGRAGPPVCAARDGAADCDLLARMWRLWAFKLPLEPRQALIFNLLQELATSGTPLWLIMCTTIDISRWQVLAQNLECVQQAGCQLHI